MGHAPPEPPSGEPSSSTQPAIGFRSLLRRVLAEVVEAHEREVEALRRALSPTCLPEAAACEGPGNLVRESSRRGSSGSLSVQEVDQTRCSLLNPADAPSFACEDPLSPDEHFDGVLPGRSATEHSTPAEEAIVGGDLPGSLLDSSKSAPVLGSRWRSLGLDLPPEYESAAPTHPRSPPRSPGRRHVGEPKKTDAGTALREAQATGLLHSKSAGSRFSWGSLSMESTDTAESQTAVKWQWMHRTGWRHYKQEEADQLESAFQNGHSKARLKSGKKGHHPMEIFFADMLQHDAASSKVRGVRRLGPDPWWKRMRRFGKSVYLQWETGRPRMESFEEFYYNDIHQIGCKNLVDEQGNIFLMPARKVSSASEQGMERKRRRASGCKKLANSAWFSSLTMLMILLNAVWIVVETDQNEADNIFEADLIFQVVENFFCAAFTAEMVVRFLSFVKKRDAFADTMFLFDLLCTVSMVVEIWLIPVSTLLMQGELDAASASFAIFRVGRLFRVTRIARLVRIIPDFVTLLKGLYRSLKSVVVSVCLLSVVIVLFAVIIRSQVKNTWLGQCCWDVELCERSCDGRDIELCRRSCDGYFHSIPETVFTLLFNGTLLDSVKKVLDKIRLQSLFLTWVFTLYVFITSCALLNMLIGIICGVVAEVRDTERERSDRHQLMLRLSSIMDFYDKGGNKTLKKDEFDLFVTNPEVRHVLTEFQVDVWGLKTFMDVYAASLAEDRLDTEVLGEDLDLDGGPALPFDEILDVVLRLRGGGGASVADMVNLRRFTGLRMDSLESKMQDIGSTR